MEDTPHFKHNHGGIFLGRFKGREFRGNGGNWDLYYLTAEEAGSISPTIMGRYGDYDGDYGVGLEFGWDGRSPEMTEARRRAEARGLDVRREDFHPYNMPNRGDLVYLNGEPRIFAQIISRTDQCGVLLWNEFPKQEHSVLMFAEFDQVTDLDGNPIQWCQGLL